VTELTKGRKGRVGCGGNKTKVTTGQHEGGVIAHNVMGLDMQVTEHSIGFPTSKEPKVINRDFAVQKGHSASGAEGFSIDILWSDARRVGSGRNGRTKEPGNLYGENRSECRTDSTEKGRRRCRETSKIVYATGHRQDRASKWVAGSAMTNSFTLVTILLGGKG
jgi:hypothetical protein